MTIEPAEPQEPQEPQEPGEPSPTRKVLEEIDREVTIPEPRPQPEPMKVVGPIRRTRLSAAPVGEETPPAEETVPEENYDVAAERGDNYHQWMKGKFRKYRDLLSVKATEDFIDHDAVNTVMADYGTICLEIVREARLYKDAAQDAKEEYEKWWSARLSEASALMPAKSTNVAVELKANELVGPDKDIRWATVKDAERRSEFLGSMKDMIHNLKGVLMNMGHSLAFEWHTTGGITVEAAGKTFRYSPARRTGERPPMEAVIAARRRKKEQ